MNENINEIPPPRLFDHAEVDQVSDEVGTLCRELRSGDSWTAARYELKKRLISCLKKERYII